MKYHQELLEDNLEIGIAYEYTEASYSQDIDIPDDPPTVEIKAIALIEGDQIDLIQFVENSNGGFLEGLEVKLLEIND